MNCLVIAATSHEIAPFLQQLREDNPLQDTDVLITGIGLMATTYALAHQLRIKRPGIIIQAGVAGCFDRSVPLGTVFAVKKEIVADLGVTEGNEIKTPVDLKLAQANQYPCTGGWLVNKNLPLKNSKLRKVTGISVNAITSAKQKATQYIQKFSPMVESMEGAALHYTALMENIPFLQLRAVSNYVTERNKKRWNMKDAIHNLNIELKKLVTTL